MRYLRHYPRFLQTILLMLLIFTLSSFSFIVANFGVTKFFGLEMGRLEGLENANVVHAMQWVQGVTSLFTYLLSALLFAYLCHPRPAAYLGLRRPGSGQMLLLAVGLIMAAVPLLAQLGAWMQLLDFGKGVRASFEEQQRMMKALMAGTTFGDLALYLLLFAVLPAVGEELLFRGVVMRFAYHNSKNIHFAVLFSAGIFGLAHGSVYHFVPIMLAGVMLGYIYYLSGSLWLSMLAHFTNNALAVLGLFAANRKAISPALAEAEGLPWYVLLISVGVLAAVAWAIKQNATPLPTDWSDDFRGEGVN